MENINVEELKNKIQNVIIKNNGVLRLGEPLRGELERFISASKLNGKEGAELLGIKEHHWHTAKARLRKLQKPKPVEFKEVKIENKPATKGLQIAIDISSVEDAAKLIQALYAKF